MRELPSGSRMSMGTPEAMVQMGEKRKPYGRLTIAAVTKRCRWSLGVGPYSRCRLLGSSGG